MKQAFHASKDYYKSRSNVGDDYIERQEFRIFLIYMYQYFEYFQLFQELDANNDQRLEFTEFKKGLSILSKWGIDIRNPEMEFRKIDVNNGGYILFDEFTDYCIRKSLDIQNPNTVNILSIILQLIHLYWFLMNYRFQRLKSLEKMEKDLWTINPTSQNR